MARKTPPPTTMTVTLPSEIDGGGDITMRTFTTRDYLAVRKGTLDDVQLLEMTLDAIVSYLPGKDPLDLPPSKLADVLSAWIEAIQERALPPATA